MLSACLNVCKIWGVKQCHWKHILISYEQYMHTAHIWQHGLLFTLSVLILALYISCLFDTIYARTYELIILCNKLQVFLVGLIRFSLMLLLFPSLYYFSYSFSCSLYLWVSHTGCYILVLSFGCHSSLQ